MKTKTKIVIFLIIAGFVLSSVSMLLGGEGKAGTICFAGAALVFLYIVFEKFFMKGKK